MESREQNRQSVYFKTNFSSNATERFDATFGSLRGAILLQNSRSAHCHIPNVFFTPHQAAVGIVQTKAAVGIVQTNEVPVLAGKWRIE